MQNEFISCEFFCLLQWSEFNVSWGSGLIADVSLDFVQIMGSHGCKSSSPANIVMKFILELNE
jgi:hypothetical protein